MIIGINAEKLLAGQENLSINTGNMKTGRSKGKSGVGLDDSDLEELMAGFEANEEDESLSSLLQNEVPAAITTHSKSSKPVAANKTANSTKTTSKAKKLIEAMSEGVVDSEEETLGNAIANKKKVHKVLTLEKMNSNAKDILSRRSQSRKNRADLVNHFDSEEEYNAPVRPKSMNSKPAIVNTSVLNISNTTEYSSDFSDSMQGNQLKKRKSDEFNVYDIEDSPVRQRGQFTASDGVDEVGYGDTKRQNVRKLNITVSKAFRNWLYEFRKR